MDTLDAIPSGVRPLSYTPAQVARITGISRTRIYELIAVGDLPAKNVGQEGNSRILVLAHELEQWLANLPEHEPTR